MPEGALGVTESTISFPLTEPATALPSLQTATAIAMADNIPMPTILAHFTI
jgi:hypothetical protein